MTHKYIVVKAHTSEISQKVGERMKDGWVALGGVSIYTSNSTWPQVYQDNVFAAQAMIKLEKGIVEKDYICETCGKCYRREKGHPDGELTRIRYGTGFDYYTVFICHHCGHENGKKVEGTSGRVKKLLR